MKHTFKICSILFFSLILSCRLSAQCGIDCIGGSTFLGVNSGVSSTVTIGWNTFLGNSAGENNTTGIENVFVGAKAGKDNGGGEKNVFIGFHSGIESTGSLNSFVGHNSGLNNTSGSDNSFFGQSSGHNNSHGERNVFIGKSSGYSNLVGDDNAFFGYKAGFEHLAGHSNIFLGPYSGYNNTIGDENIYLGRSAGFYNTGDMDNNTFIGTYSGHFINGNMNVCIGANSGPSGAFNALANVSERLYIDNIMSDSPLIYGEFNNNLIRINGEFHTSGDVGIGTNNPTQRLDVNGAIRIANTTTNSDGSLRYDGNNFLGHHNGQWISLDNNVWSETSSSASYMDGKVGIGTTNPNSKLHVNADTNEDAFRVQSNGSSKLTVGFNGGTSIGAFASAPANGLYVDGNTGLGISSPTQKLSVDGAIRISNTSANSNGTIRYNGTNFQGHHNGQWLNLDEQGGVSGGSVWTVSGSDAHYTTGRVGIGTNNPNSTLHIDGLGGQNPIRAAIAGQTKFHVSSNGGVSIGTPSAPPGNGLAVSGNVGIGTTTPAQKLTVVGDASITGALVAPSDRRLKENIESIENALELINKLQPRTYVHEENKIKELGLSEDIQYGLIAQELEEILPSLVVDKALTDVDGLSYKGVEYEQLIPILIQSIKEMDRKNDALKIFSENLLEKYHSLEDNYLDLSQRIAEIEDESN